LVKLFSRRRRQRRGSTILVIGLGRFGSAVAESLMHMGHEVLGADADMQLVESMADKLTQTVQIDSTNINALRQLGVCDFEAAVVGIGTDMEASVLTTMALVDLGMNVIWAKANNARHGQILERTGAHHVIYPEARMGERVAHIIAGKMIDYIEFDEDFALVKTRAPAILHDRTLADSDIRKSHGVTVVGLKSPHASFTYAQADTVVRRDDLLIVSGRIEDVERFAALK